MILEPEAAMNDGRPGVELLYWFEDWEFDVEDDAGGG
jgi:hypothetical protein